MAWEGAGPLHHYAEAQDEAEPPRRCAEALAEEAPLWPSEQKHGDATGEEERRGATPPTPTPTSAAS